MKTVVATLALTAAMLSAGAFAGNSAMHRPNPAVSNVTVIVKNQAWPVKTFMTIEPCKMTRCVDA